MEPVLVHRGASPLVLAFPHVGTFVPDDIRATLNNEGQLLRDTDWHVERLYEGLAPDATTVQATFHRYVIDANRPPSGESLYPGHTTTGLVPITTFDNEPIWRDGQVPDAAEIARRRDAFFAPYHAALQAELDRVKAAHGYAVLYDCHSIRSEIPWLFEGTLPDLNLGTFDGRSCAPAIEAAARAACEWSGRTNVVNGRFKGGWTTRHYGQPQSGVHALQMELTQSSHLESEEPPFRLSAPRATALRPVLVQVLAHVLEAAAALPRC